MEIRNTARVSLSHFACFVCLFVSFCFFNEKTEGQPATPNKCSEVQILLGGVFEEQKLPPQKILLSLQYISNYIKKKSSRRVEVSAHSNISQNCVSKCTRLHLSVHSFQKNFQGSMPPDPARNRVAFGHSGLLPQTINPRQNPGSPPISNQAKKARSFVTVSNNVRARVRVPPLYLFMDISPTSRFTNNLFANVLSRFANMLDQFSELLSPDHWLKGNGRKFMCIGLFRVMAEEQGILFTCSACFVS